MSGTAGMSGTIYMSRTADMSGTAGMFRTPGTAWPGCDRTAGRQDLMKEMVITFCIWMYACCID